MKTTRLLCICCVLLTTISIAVGGILVLSHTDASQPTTSSNEFSNVTSSETMCSSAQSQNVSSSTDEVNLEKNPFSPSLSGEDRSLIEKVVYAEANAESIIGQMAVAQCIRDTAEYKNLSVKDVISNYQYAKPWTGKIDEHYFAVTKQAVSLVFDQGSRVTPHRIMYFYAPGKVQSTFHESQVYVCTIGQHKFFDERGQ